MSEAAMAFPPERAPTPTVNITKLRELLGTPDKPMSQSELARRCKTAASTIHRYENNPSLQRGPLKVLLQKLYSEATQDMET